ncbi:uncharacterized protein LOC119574212 isoform X2 [Penaeus monodon]|uniref:uncharacterized protein LOC119574212 isoform X2 n=1 Tax=Penaeus monodon TaxID=6687 RepID=UPI0018A6EFEC|nr:uncharacterized protein LOC119574212 isoform X2 [Penaeus monodon]
MNKYIVGSAVLVTLLGLYVRQADALLCWECNSAFDPRCSEDNFDPYTLATVDCDQLELEHLQGMVATSCRKITQIIGDHQRTIRGCGWIEEQRDDCYSRTGTKDIVITYCHCNEDNCNSGHSVMASLGLATLLLVLTKIF